MYALWARELLVGFARLGQVAGIITNNPMREGGVLFDSRTRRPVSRPATRWHPRCCSSPDVPGLVGTAVERQGIIRHGAKMISAVSDATVPKICVVLVRKASRSAYAIASRFDPDVALPTAKIAVMGAEAAVNAVYAGKLAGHRRPGRARGRGAAPPGVRPRYRRHALAGDLVVDDVQPEDLRGELIRRFAAALTAACRGDSSGIAPV